MYLAQDWSNHWCSSATPRVVAWRTSGRGRRTNPICCRSGPASSLAEDYDCKKKVVLLVAHWIVANITNLKALVRSSMRLLSMGSDKMLLLRLRNSSPEKVLSKSKTSGQSESKLSVKSSSAMWLSLVQASKVPTINHNAKSRDMFYYFICNSRRGGTTTYFIMIKESPLHIQQPTLTHFLLPEFLACYQLFCPIFLPMPRSEPNYKTPNFMDIKRSSVL